MNIFVLTGAGVSAESGLATFRDPGGLWERYSPYELATPEAFAADPGLVRRFYDWRRRQLAAVEPNPAHRALARLQRELLARGGALFLCTQNVDDLHERGGSTDVVHMHGELRKARCLACRAVSPWTGDMAGGHVCPACGAPGRLRPHVVWFGEVPLAMDEIEAALARADLFVSVGTSGSVYPAAGLVAQARRCGARTLELNLERSDNARAFDEVRTGPASEIVPAWVKGVLGRRGRNEPDLGAG